MYENNELNRVFAFHRIATSGKMDEYDIDDDFDNDWSYEFEKKGWFIAKVRIENNVTLDPTSYALAYN